MGTRREPHPLPTWRRLDVQAFMGHANINTTMIYAHHMPKHSAAGARTRLVGQNIASDGRATVDT